MKDKRGGEGKGWKERRRRATGGKPKKETVKEFERARSKMKRGVEWVRGGGGGRVEDKRKMK